MELFRPKDVAAEQAGSRMGVGELPFEPHFGCISACFYTEWAFCVWICCTGLRFELPVGGGAGLFAMFGLCAVAHAAKSGTRRRHLPSIEGACPISPINP